MRMRYLPIFLYLLFVSSCNTRQQKINHDTGPGKEEMAELNRYMVQKDRERIQNYIERKGLDMIEAESGLWYMITSEGEGENYGDNDRIRLDYECCLLDGTFCYSSDDTGPLEIVLGHGNIPSGLDQGLRMLSPGGKALFIIPPFLAYGITGDGVMIPPRSIIVYEVSVNNE